MVKLLKSRGADISKKLSKEGCVPLHVAAAGGYAEIVRYLLEQGVDIDVQTNTDETPRATSRKTLR